MAYILKRQRNSNGCHFVPNCPNKRPQCYKIVELSSTYVFWSSPTVEY